MSNKKNIRKIIVEVDVGEDVDRDTAIKIFHEQYDDFGDWEFRDSNDVEVTD